MTSDELRQKCFEAMATAVAHQQGFRSFKNRAEIIAALIKDLTPAFDALHGLVYVTPIEATEEMIEAGADCGDWGPGIHCDGTDASPENCWRAMAAAGDLTRPR